jgi:hypothetical protein
MKVKQILSIKEIADDKKLPCDMYELYDTKYMSVSRDEMISIEDMDIVHLIRAFKNDRHRLANQLTDADLIRQNEDLVSANKELAKQHDKLKDTTKDIIKEKDLAIYTLRSSLDHNTSEYKQLTDTLSEMGMYEPYDKQGRARDYQVEYTKLAKQRDAWKEKAMNMVEKSSYQVMWDNCQELQKKLDQEVRIDTQEGKVVELEDTLKNTIKANNELIQLNKQLKESLRQVNLTPTVSTQAYDIAWKNNEELKDQMQTYRDRNAVLSRMYNSSLSSNQKLNEQVAYWKKLAEDNFIQSVDDNENTEFWKKAYMDYNPKPKGCGYMFSEIPNDTDGQEFVDTMKKYFNKKSYKMRVKGQHIKPELKGTGATYWGQNISESSHLRVYIEIK